MSLCAVFIMLLAFNCRITEAFVNRTLPGELSYENFINVSINQYQIWISENERIMMDRDLSSEEIYYEFIEILQRKGMRYTTAELYARRMAKRYAAEHRYEPWFSGNTVQFYTGWVTNDKEFFEIVRWSYYPATGEIRKKHRYQFSYKDGEIGNLKDDNLIQQKFRKLLPPGQGDDVIRYALKKYGFM